MNEITIHNHLLLPTIIAVLSILLVLFKKDKLIFKTNKNFYFSLLLFFGLYLLIVGNALYQDLFHQWNLNKYDLDKDGFFSGNEINESQKNAMQQLTNDTGRNFSFIIGLLFSCFVSTLTFLILSVSTKINKRFTS
jgi:energy-coupling factor transporter transmembrane protein EcfT